MMNKCPFCGGSVYQTSNGLKCRSCGAVICESSPIHEAPFVKEEKPFVPFESKPKKASEVFQKSVSGVCIVINIEDQSDGSGFIYKSSGLVITNAHVVHFDKENRPSKNLMIVIDGKDYLAHVVQSTCSIGTQDDVALLQIDSNNYFEELEIGHSNNVHTGDEVFAIGNPKGEGIAITRGIVSDASRETEVGQLLMSDVSINGGNSGGPLFNDEGKVIAICMGSRCEADNMNFFIPINHVLEIIHHWGY